MNEISFTIQYGRRKKTIALTVLPDGTVMVYAPRTASKHFIQRFVQRKWSWIKKRQQHLQEHPAKHRTLSFVSGEQVSLFGEFHQLEVHREAVLPMSLVNLRGSKIHVTLSPEEINPQEKIRDALRSWFTEKTAVYISDHIEAYKKRLGLSPSQIKIVSAGRRWGSCSRRGVLRFNWKLSMMPPAVIHYVLVHEMCHLKELNHSHKFWDLVRELHPEYKDRRHWLRHHGEHLWN